jgi:BirA family biotin operon repressor/biotin-[acetyl-CoA-carboxylase] ligase
MLAKAGAAAGLPEGHLWIAETQTKGRGRLERSWESGYGGLWFSLLLRPKLPPGRVTPLTLVAGLALRQAVEDSTGVRAKLKWPNDLMVASPRAGAAPLPMGEGYKKLAGILTEMSGQMERTEWVAVGAGLNVTNALSPDLSRRACSLLDVTGKVCPRARLLAAFLGNFDKAYRRFAVEGFGPFRKAYWKHYLAPDLPVRLKTAGGLVSGIARGVDDAGGIMIEFRRKISVFTEGEII